MLLRKTLHAIVFGVFVLLINISEATSHPWGGLVIDNEGNIYFTFICPFVDDHHYACVWKLDSENSLEEVLKARRSPSDIVLKRNTKREIFGTERSGNSPNYMNSLWEINREGVNQIIQPNTNQELFHIQAYAITDNGHIYFARNGTLYYRTSDTSIAEVNLGSNVNRIQLLEIGPSNSLYIMADDNLYIRENADLKLLAKGLRESNPENIPFRGANIMFDMAVDEYGNVYLAYYGNRKVIRVSKTGEVSDILEAQAPWSPHGVDIYDGEIFVLESTLGDGAWWKFWNRNNDEIIPRIRKISSTGTVSEVFNFSPD